mmetsp:Transcript_9226/g.30447  ORF Transcript_9226/g.30447 Transcript_9226/m.30447 type:complete len:304 (-) Transcript_9226:189-1100(-)
MVVQRRRWECGSIRLGRGVGGRRRRFGSHFDDILEVDEALHDDVECVVEVEGLGRVCGGGGSRGGLAPALSAAAVDVCDGHLRLPELALLVVKERLAVRDGLLHLCVVNLELLGPLLLAGDGGGGDEDLVLLLFGVRRQHRAELLHLEVAVLDHLAEVLVRGGERGVPHEDVVHLLKLVGRLDDELEKLLVHAQLAHHLLELLLLFHLLLELELERHNLLLLELAGVDLVLLLAQRPVPLRVVLLHKLLETNHRLPDLLLLLRQLILLLLAPLHPLIVLPLLAIQLRLHLLHLLLLLQKNRRL